MMNISRQIRRNNQCWRRNLTPGECFGSRWKSFSTCSPTFYRDLTDELPHAERHTPLSVPRVDAGWWRWSTPQYSTVLCEPQNITLSTIQFHILQIPKVSESKKPYLYVFRAAPLLWSIGGRACKSISISAFFIIILYPPTVICLTSIGW